MGERIDAAALLELVPEGPARERLEAAVRLYNATMTDEELTFELRKPLAVGEETFASITLKEPTAGNLKEIAGKRHIEAQIHLVQLCSGLPMAAVQKMGARDFNQASDFLAGFL